MKFLKKMNTFGLFSVTSLKVHVYAEEEKILDQGNNKNDQGPVQNYL